MSFHLIKDCPMLLLILLLSLFQQLDGYHQGLKVWTSGSKTLWTSPHLRPVLALKYGWKDKNHCRLNLSCFYLMYRKTSKLLSLVEFRSSIGLCYRPRGGRFGRSCWCSRVVAGGFHPNGYHQVCGLPQVQVLSLEIPDRRTSNKNATFIRDRAQK